MLHVKNILVPTDFSDGSALALDHALGLAERTSAAVHLLHVEVLYEVSKGLQTGLPHTVEDALNTLKQYAEDMTFAWTAEGSAAFPMTYEVVRDIAAAPAILNYAEVHDVDVIVMGTHGRRGVRRMMMGSVAEEVVRLARCPVLTLHEGETDVAEGGAAPTFVVPIDFSLHAKEALRYAKAMADLYGARLHLLHVVEETLHPAFYEGGVLSAHHEIRADLDAQAEAQLKVLYDEVGGDPAVVTFEVATGHADDEIVAAAKRTGAALIVMATQGLRGIERVFLGSVAARVVRRATCPVFILKAFGKSLLQRPALKATTTLAPA